ncbi:hypothetical protein [Bacteroides ndongoniae]|uniref:hypothetical protein n=1 Tax=Bacteroides ndongoniae TaxID=1903262 RepID=UPI0013563216|nr:hypothetical protein [Bacteroides ndongoniae]
METRGGNSPAAEGAAGKGTAREQNRAASPPDGTTPAKREQKLYYAEWGASEALVPS